MSNVVDDRVVKMKFDNKEFESNVGDTLKSLEDLDKNLKNMDKGSYGDGLGRALGGIGNAVDDLSNRFSTWGIVGMEVIQRLTDFAIDKGVEMAKALSVDQITAGWQKYEEVSSNIYAIANQVSHGETFEDVTRAIEKLSWYSDATSFSLSDMTSALSGFVAQGVDLETATSMIMGMGNSITYAGANAKEGSGAFDAFSKSFGKGYLDLQRWNQLSSTYRVTTYELKKQALDTAVALNKLSVSYDEDGKALYTTLNGLTFTFDQFNESLGHKEGKWLDRDVMQALYGDTGKYGEYISGLAEYIQMIKETTGEQLTWNEATERYAEYLAENGMAEDEFGRKVADSATVAKTLSEAIDAVKDASSSQWERIFEGLFGTVDKAKVVWSDFSDWLNGLFVGPLNNVANIITSWSKLPQELGGQDSFIQIFRNLAAAAERVVQPIQKAWEVIHGTKTTEEMAAKLGEIIKSVELFTESLFSNEEVAAKFQRVWEVIFEVLKTVGEGLNKIWGLLKALGGIIKPIIGLLGNLVVGIADIIDVIFKVFNLDGNLWTWLQKPTNALKKIGTALADTLSIFDIAKGPVVEGVVGAFDNLGDSVRNVTEPIGEVGKSLGDLWEQFKSSEGFVEFKNNAYNAFLLVAQTSHGFFEEFKNTYAQEGGGIVGVAKGAYSSIRMIIGSVYDALGIMLDDHFGEQLEKIKEFASNAEKFISDKFGKIKTLVTGAVSSLTSSLFGDNIFGSLGESQNETGKQLNMFGQMRQNIDKELKSTQNAGKAMVAITNGVSAIGVGGAMLRINQILKNVSEMIKSLKGTWDSIGGTFDSLTNSLKTMQLEVKADIIKDIALALAVLAASLIAISLIPTEKLGPAVAAITALIIEMGVLMGAISNMDFGSSMMSAENNGVLGKKFQKTSSNMTKAAMTILEMSGAILILAAAMKQISDIPQDKLLASFGVISGLLLELGLFAKFTNSATGGLGGNVGMNIFKMASGLVVMAQAMKMLAELDDENNSLGKGLGAVGGILTMLFLFSSAMSKWGGGKDIGDMGSLIAMAAGLAALALVIQIYANIPTEGLIQGGSAVAAVLTAIGTFMTVLTKFGVSGTNMLKVSASLVIFAGALNLIALAMIAMNLVTPAALFGTLGIIAGFIGAALLLGPASSALIGFSVAIGIFGAGIAGIGVGLLAFSTAMTLISMEAPAFAAGLIATLGALLIGFVSLKPEIVSAVITLVEVVCESLIGSIDTILSTVDAIFLALAEHLLSTLANLVTIFETYWPTIHDALSRLWSSIWQKLQEWAPKVWEWLKNLFLKIKNIVAEHWPEWLKKLGQFLLNVLKALAKFAGQLLLKFLKWLVSLPAKALEKVGEFVQAGKELIQNLWDGFTSKFEEALEDVGGFVLDIISAIGDFFVSIFNTGVSLIDSFLGGIFSKDEDVYNAGAGTVDQYNSGLNNEDKGYESKRAGENLAGQVKEGVESVDMESVGANVIKGLIRGLKEKRANADLKRRCQEIGGETLTSFKISLQEQSPSKATEEMGIYLIEGLGNGLKDKAALSELKDKAKELGFTILEEMQDEINGTKLKLEIEKSLEDSAVKAIKEIIDNIETEAGTEIKITPVLSTEEMQKSLDEWDENYKIWEKAYNSTGYASDYSRNGFGSLSRELIFGSGNSTRSIRYGKGTLDLVAAAANGFLNAEQRAAFMETATPAEQARTNAMLEALGRPPIVFNQTINSPKSVDADEVYRQTNNAAGDIILAAKAT